MPEPFVSQTHPHHCNTPTISDKSSHEEGVKKHTHFTPTLSSTYFFVAGLQLYNGVYGVL
jgi:hypothetical protein